MKKVLAILGSPRKNGNSATLAHRAIEGVCEAGGQCEAFWLHGMSIRPCQACDACRRQSEKRCVQKDDMQTLYDALEQADALLLASPVYMFTMSAQLKLFMDRCYAVPDALKGKRVGVVLAYGGDDETDSGAIHAMRAIEDNYAYQGAEVMGIVHGSADLPGEIAANAGVMDAAYALGRALIG
jgi:multimeric flavodoxin WrbA